MILPINSLYRRKMPCQTRLVSFPLDPSRNCATLILADTTSSHPSVGKCPRQNPSPSRRPGQFLIRPFLISLKSSITKKNKTEVGQWISKSTQECVASGVRYWRRRSSPGAVDQKGRAPCRARRSVASHLGFSPGVSDWAFSLAERRASCAMTSIPSTASTRQISRRLPACCTATHRHVIGCGAPDIEYPARSLRLFGSRAIARQLKSGVRRCLYSNASGYACRFALRLQHATPILNADWAGPQRALSWPMLQEEAPLPGRSSVGLLAYSVTMSAFVDTPVRHVIETLVKLQRSARWTSRAFSF